MLHPTTLLQIPHSPIPKYPIIPIQNFHKHPIFPIHKHNQPQPHNTKNKHIHSTTTILNYHFLNHHKINYHQQINNITPTPLKPKIPNHPLLLPHFFVSA
ncbi:plasmid recombination protein, partial [Priestia megaterium]|uniref:plasmid recombination protein n=1 Tax=Priestia megaterium TaxID=1404 RepID=UPI0037096ACC